MFARITPWYCTVLYTIPPNPPPLFPAKASTIRDLRQKLLGSCARRHQRANSSLGLNHPSTPPPPQAHDPPISTLPSRRTRRRAPEITEPTRARRRRASLPRRLYRKLRGGNGIRRPRMRGNNVTRGTFSHDQREPSGSRHVVDRIAPTRSWILANTHSPHGLLPHTRHPSQPAGESPISSSSSSLAQRSRHYAPTSTDKKILRRHEPPGPLTPVPSDPRQFPLSHRRKLQRIQRKKPTISHRQISHRPGLTCRPNSLTSVNSLRLEGRLVGSV